MPKVTNGQLDEPYPIRTRGDVNRAKVLPPPRIDKPSPKRAVPDAKITPPRAAPNDSQDLEQPNSAFDYVVQRNRMLKRTSARSRRRSDDRRA